jgi:hypothetical protein
MKKILIAALMLTATSTPVYASNAGGRTWDLCPFTFPGLGFLTNHFLLPCRVGENPGGPNY